MTGLPDDEKYLLILLEVAALCCSLPDELGVAELCLVVLCGVGATLSGVAGWGCGPFSTKFWAKRSKFGSGGPKRVSLDPNKRRRQAEVPKRARTYLNRLLKQNTRMAGSRT